MIEFSYMSSCKFTQHKQVSFPMIQGICQSNKWTERLNQEISMPLQHFTSGRQETLSQWEEYTNIHNTPLHKVTSILNPLDKEDEKKERDGESK